MDDLRKAAVLLLSLDKPLAAEVLSLLPRPAVEAVSMEIARVEDVTADQQAQALGDFDADVGGRVYVGRGGLASAEELLNRSLGEEGGLEILEAVKQSLTSVPFAFLQKAGADNLLTFISEEHPQTIALILSHLPGPLAAEVVSGLSPVKQIDVIRRVAGMEQTSPDVVKEVEASLRRRMTSTFDTQLEKAGGVPRVAEILNVTDRMTNKTILENLEQDDAELAEEIRRLMFVFEDLLKLDNKAIQSLLKEVDNATWAVALKGASEEIADKILGNLSQRAADALREEMSYLGPVKLSDVEGRQQLIVDAVRRLEDAGEIEVSSGADAEQYVT